MLLARASQVVRASGTWSILAQGGGKLDKKIIKVARKKGMKLGLEVKWDSKEPGVA